MTSRRGPSSRPQTSRFPVVLARIIPSARPTRVWLAISNRIYWKVVNDNDETVPSSLSDFRGANSLIISRLANCDDWGRVEAQVMEGDDDQGLSVIVQGKLRGPVRRWPKSDDAKLVLTAVSAEQRDGWLNELRMRVASPELIHQRVFSHLSSMRSSASLREVREEVEKLLDCDNAGLERDLINAEVGSPSDIVEPISQVQEGIQRVQLADKSTDQGRKLVGAIAITVKMKARSLAESVDFATQANRMVKTAQRAADVTGAIAGVSSVFQLVAVSARCAAKLANSSHGSRELLKLLAEVICCHGILMDCMRKILFPSIDAQHVLMGNVFRVLTDIIDTMGAIEDYLMEGKVGQFLDSKLVEVLETVVKELQERVVTVFQSTTLLTLRQERETETMRNVGELDRRPMLSELFVGRLEELKKLRTMVSKYGSAVISQFGGIGKTQLMVKFSEDAELDGSIPGGSYWVTADGGKEQVIDSLACFVEKVRRRKLTETDRRDPVIVVAALKRFFATAKGRWLLCLDNVDNAVDPKVSNVLDMVCSIANPAKRNGWVVVTSRQGRSTLWDGMKKDQRLELGPLSKEDSMCLLWRFVKSIKTQDEDDNTLMGKVSNLEITNRTEFYAMVELCGLSGANSLGGLPLALVQAGTYMRQFNCSFSDYLNCYKEADGKAGVEELLQKSKEFDPVRPEQRAILTTWKISVERLSDDALKVLRALSMLGNALMPRALVKRVLKNTIVGGTSTEFKLLLMIQKELVHGTSLIQEEKVGVFNIHRLVRLFVLLEIEIGSETWNSAFLQASNSTHECLALRLEREGRSFDDLNINSMFDEKHRTWSFHSLAIVHRCSQCYPAVKEFKVLMDIHEYAGTVSKFLGRYSDEQKAREGLVKLAQKQYGYDLSHPQIAMALGMLGSVYKNLGKGDEAQSTLLQCLKMLRELYGHCASHSAIASTLGNLGMVYQNLGKLHEAESTQLECLKMDRELFGYDVSHPEIARSLGNLGCVYHDLGKLNEAKSTHLESLKMKRAVYGNGAPHPEIAATLSNLGFVYRDRGELNEAKSALLASLRMKRKIYWHDLSHPEIAATLGNLGNVYASLGKIEEATSTQFECLKMKREAYGHNVSHPAIARTLGNLGWLYQKLGKLDEAMSTQLECLKMFREIHGNDVFHPSIAGTLGNLGVVYCSLGKLEEAKSMQLECLEMCREIHGYDVPHPSIASTLGDLGVVYLSLGKLEEAKSMQLECLEMFREIHGYNVPHPSIAITLGDLGVVYHYLGKLEEAKSTQLKSLKMKRELYGYDDSHPEIARTLVNLSKIYDSQRRQS